jgi:hypothetical protein
MASIGGGRELDEHRKVRILAMAVQHHGADPSTVKQMLDDPNFGMDPSVSDRVHAHAMAMAANTRGGRHER